MRPTERTAYGVLLAICFCHMNNDMLQSVIVASYPVFKQSFRLTFAQIGLVTLAYQVTASLLQPMVGVFADRRPSPYALPAGTLFTFAGLLALSRVDTFPGLIAGACTFGVGSSVFHPESSRVARMASGGRPGLAQSLFQVGGNVGAALGPVGAAIVVMRWGRRSLGAVALLALVSTVVLCGVGAWCKRRGPSGLEEGRAARAARERAPRVSRATLRGSIAVLLALIFSKFVYLASFTSYYTFYLMRRFGLRIASAQIYLFVFLASVAAGTLAGGSLGDRFGRKRVIWLSILGVLPFTLALPHASLLCTGALTVVIGFVLASAFPAIVVYGQELLPDRIGMVSGLFFGLSFGAAGLGAALLGRLADSAGIERVYAVVAFLPAIGLLAALLPDLRARPAIDGAPREGPLAEGGPGAAAP